MMMKKYLSYILVACSIPFFSFCTKGGMDEGSINTINKGTDESGVCNIEKALSAVPATKGILNNSDFDSNYDPDYIFLYSADGQVKVEFPVYTFTCEQGNECYGLCYQIRQDDNGKTTITPFNASHNLMEDRTVELPEDGQFYFSSLETNEWSLPDEQVEQREGYTFYKRKSDINREIYRSAENFTIETLNESAPLVIHRACAAFNVVGLFYDSSNYSVDDEGGIIYSMTVRDFIEIMGSDPSTWYIKIYAGGPAFTDAYNLGSQTSTGSNPGGYYSTGDSDHFASGSIDACSYLSFTSRFFGMGDNTYSGFGYYTRAGNHLFTPVTGGEEINVYILIKHWTGVGEPDDEWLLSDQGALQTQASISGTGGQFIPTNNSFYTLGVIMDINQFKNAWEAAGGDAAAATKSGGVREFTLDDAITIFETDSF